ncbi:MAG: hypothetical protein Phog2KO_24900 [Phototrophicaceae bacterium]
MSLEFTIDVIEQKKDLLFVAGISLGELEINAEFSHLYQYGSSKKSKKLLSKVTLKVESIIVEGEPVDKLTQNSTGMIALSGDFSEITEQASNLKWRKKSGRFIRTSDIALTLADS